jgi:hypothetical protein
VVGNCGVTVRGGVEPDLVTAGSPTVELESELLETANNFSVAQSGEAAQLRHPTTIVTIV